MRYFAAMAFKQLPRQRDDVPGLGVVQADAADVALEPVLAQRQHRLRRIGHRKQTARGLVDADISGLRRQHHGHQQFVRRAVMQLGDRMRVEFAQPGEKLDDLRAFHGLVECRRDCARARASSTGLRWVPASSADLRAASSSSRATRWLSSRASRRW